MQAGQWNFTPLQSFYIIQSNINYITFAGALEYRPTFPLNHMPADESYKISNNI